MRFDNFSGYRQSAVFHIYLVIDGGVVGGGGGEEGVVSKARVN